MYLAAVEWGRNWTPQPFANFAAFAAGDENRWRAADVNGDGKSDLVAVTKPAALPPPAASSA